MNLDEAREAFLSFFEKNEHERTDRASVVARWRNDIYLSIASIAVFQPHVTSGSSKPPANPLTISQPCIRLNDLESVGRRLGGIYHATYIWDTYGKRPGNNWETSER